MQVRTRARVARRLRRDATDAETRLWWLLRDAFPGMRFRRQHPLGRFVVDFACPAHKLAIELDGGQHAAQVTDQRRTEELARRGYRVIRFWNNDIFQNSTGVLAAIEAALTQSSVNAGQKGRSNNPSPPLRGEREGPTPEAWEGEVGAGDKLGGRPGIPHLTPALSAPGGGEGILPCGGPQDQTRS